MRQPTRQVRPGTPEVCDSGLFDKAATAVGWAIGLGLAALLAGLALWGPQ